MADAHPIAGGIFLQRKNVRAELVPVWRNRVIGRGDEDFSVAKKEVVLILPPPRSGSVSSAVSIGWCLLHGALTTTHLGKSA